MVKQNRTKKLNKENRHDVKTGQSYAKARQNRSAEQAESKDSAAPQNAKARTANTSNNFAEQSMTHDVNNSVFARRIVVLLICALLFSAVLTIMIYYFTVNYIYQNNVSTQYTEYAAYLAEKNAERYAGKISDDVYENSMENATKFLDALIIVYMYRENVFDINFSSKLSDLPANYIEDTREFIKQHNYAIMNQQITSFTEKVGANKTKSLFVGYPIVAVEQYSKNTSTIGSVYIITDLDKEKSELTNLNFSLILASSLTFLLILFPLLYIIKRLINPLIETKDIALAMSKGDFSRRATVQSDDEIGELAMAVNNLADDLDETLSNLRLERNRLQQIVNGLGEGILALGKNMEVMHINPALLQLFNVDNLSDAAAAEYILSLANLRSLFTQVMQTKTMAEVNIKHRDIVIEVKIDPWLNDKGESYGAVALFRDITEAWNLDKTRRDYVSNISHELRTPLTAVRGLVEPLADGLVKDEDTKLEYYRIILQETMRLSRLIDDMMSLSRLQSGQVNVKPQKLDAEEFIQNIAYKYWKPMQDKGIKFVLPEQDELAHMPYLYINPDRLEQVVVIIIDNAMKFTKEGGSISINFSPDKKRADSVLMCIADTGAGIAEEDLNHIFERFYKADKARGRSEGTGLGLSIAKEMLEDMGERIWVESKVCAGSSFYFSIKLYNGQDESNKN